MPMFKKFMALFVLTLFTSSTLVSGQEALYKDTKLTDWFYGSLNSMSTEKIITGYPDGTFRGSDVLAIDQYTTMLCRLTGNDVGVAEGYWAKNYLDFASAQGWFKGLTIASFGSPINRYQAAVLTARAMKIDETNAPDQLEDYAMYIDDIDQIPTKYKTEILINYALGITTGYPDGTFKGTNTLTRAEGAVMSHRVLVPNVRKKLLVPEKAEALMPFFAFPLPPMLPLEGEVTMEGGQMMFFIPGGAFPLPINSLDLNPDIAADTENILADAILELSDLESDNQIAAGYSYGVFNINLLSKDNESLLIYSANSGSNVISIDLLLLADEEGNLRPDASDFILLICKNIDYDNAEAMHSFILTNYEDRYNIPVEGNDVTLDSTHLGISSLVHDHNVLKVTITTD